MLAPWRWQILEKYKTRDSLISSAVNKAEHMSDIPQQGTLTLKGNTGQQSLSHTNKLTHTVHTQDTYCTTTFIFNRQRFWCIFQQWEVLDGNFCSTAVKECITQRAIQSRGQIFTSPLLAHYREQIRASSSSLKTHIEREMHIYYTWYMWLCGMNRPQQIGHILLWR